MKNAFSVSVAVLILLSCDFNISKTSPADGNQSPYFVDISEQDNTTATGYNILLGRKYHLSFDSTVKVTVRHFDSSYTCSGSKCTWQYIEKKDTVVDLAPSFSVTDTVRFFRTVQYSFFDAENDSCEILMELSGNGVTIRPDSVWGDVHTRPGMNKTISAIFLDIYSQQSDFNLPGGSINPSSFKTVLTIIQTNDSRRSYQDTISGFVSIGDTDSVVSGNEFSRMLTGKWVLKVEPMWPSNMFRYASKDYEYIIRNDSLFSNTYMVGNGCRFSGRTGWSGVITNPNSNDYMNPTFYFTLVGNDTLITPQLVDSRRYWMAVYVRDKSYDGNP